MARAQFGQLDFDPQFDFRQHLIEPRVTRTVLQLFGRGPKAIEIAGVEGAGEETELDLIKDVERRLAFADRAPAPLGGIVDPLQGDQRVDTPHHAQGRDSALRFGGVGGVELERA